MVIIGAKWLSLAEAKYKAACNRVIDAKVAQWKRSKVTGSRSPTQLIDTLTLYAYSEDQLPWDEKADCFHDLLGIVS